VRPPANCGKRSEKSAAVLGHIRQAGTEENERVLELTQKTSVGGERRATKRSAGDQKKKEEPSILIARTKQKGGGLEEKSQCRGKEEAGGLVKNRKRKDQSVDQGERSLGRRPLVSRRDQRVSQVPRRRRSKNRKRKKKEKVSGLR